ncbi:hypothetical protein DD237_006987 [Peronospora effusa]|uniref:PWWP domain-containing protein n=1 Tax=Peronospora effusa TaxID=542832 RepID=A0A3R7VZY3_9STRA|nr:hypothetical protein DD237_006987 [Peronospora effusa]
MNAEVPAFQVGDWLDVIDSDGIWNVAQVLQLLTAETVIITYDCWGDAYNEELRRDSDRIAPYHTHTWAVKCWAKLTTWPWWPALLTIRAPGTSMGAQNLRLEENLLVDFLDKAEFSKRFRCWVKKNNIVGYQSDKVTRIRQTKLKMRGFKGEARSKNLAFAMKLLTKCDGQENLPKFVQGTLPVQFEHNVTRSIEEVRKEIGEEKWMRGFVENRINHAATHAYTPVVAGSGKSNIEFSNFVDKTTDASAEGAPNMSQKQENQSSPLLDVEIVSTVSTNKKATVAPTVLVTNKVTTQEPTNARKRARSNAEDAISDRTDSRRAGDVTSSRTQTPNEFTKQSQDPNSANARYREEKKDEKASKQCTVTKELHIMPQRYGKTPKKLKTARRSASKLPPYSPPYARLLPRAEPRDEEHTASPSHARHATQSRPRVENGNALADTMSISNHLKMTCANGLQTGGPDKVLLASDRHLQQPNAAVRRVLACESKPSDESVSSMKRRAPLANATLQADEKPRNTKTGLSGKLAQLTEKAAEAEEIRKKCAALRKSMDDFIRLLSTIEQKDRKDSQVHLLTPDVASETQGVIQEALPLGSNSYDSFMALKSPTFARRSLQPTCATRRLELALDNVIMKQQGYNLNAATTQLEAIKAELLRSPEVQAAINRMEYPSYGRVAPAPTGKQNHFSARQRISYAIMASIAGISFRERSTLSNGNFGCTLEEVKKPRYLKSLLVTGQSARRPSQRPSSQQLDRSWRYNLKSEASSEESHLSTCSILPGPPPADHSTFGFSVDDNFSMNQWYRDLYPKSFGFQ